MALDAARKANLAKGEMGAFFSQTGKVIRFNRSDSTYSGKSYTIFTDAADPEGTQKAAAVHTAVQKITNKGVNIPTGLCVYCTNSYEAQNRAFHRDLAWNEVALVILGSKAMTGGRPDALSGTGLGGCNPAAITCVHEIGHILHEHGAGDVFWETGSALAGKAASSGEVSGYAGQNKKEFVAEVFAGLILGKTFSGACLAEYNSFSGPAVP